MNAEWVSAGIVGTVLGMGLGLFALPHITGESAREGVTTGSDSVAAAAPCPPAVRAQGERDLGQLEVAAARARIATLEQERIAIAGEPIDWPEGLDPAFGPDGAEALLTRAAEAAGATLLGIECEEFPCVATLTIDVEGSNGVFSGEMDPALVETLEAGGAEVWRDVMLQGLPDERYALIWYAVLVPEGQFEREGELGRRSSFRAHALGDLVWAEEQERRRAR